MADGLDVGGHSAVNGVDKCCLNNGGDVDRCISLMHSSDLLVTSKMGDNDRSNDTAAGENVAPPRVLSENVVNDNERQDHSSLEMNNCVNSDDDVRSNSDDDDDSLHAVSGECQPDIESDTACEREANDTYCIASSEAEKSADHVGNVENQIAGQRELSSPQRSVPSVTASVSCGLENSETKELAASNLDVNHDADKLSLVVDSEPQLEYEDDKVQTASGTADSEQPDDGLLCEATDKNSSHGAGCVTCDSVTKELAASNLDENHDTDELSVVVDSEPQLECEDDKVQTASEQPDDGLLCEATDEYSKNSSHGAGSVSCDSETKELPASNLDGNHDADESSVVVDSEPHLECEDDQVQTVSGKADSEQPNDGLLCETSSSVSASQVSAADVTSSASSLCTVAKVVTSTPLSGSELPAVVSPGNTASASAVSATSNSGVRRSARHSDKSSVPPAAAGSTRLMSKVLQDVGLLLVSQRVFKNLATIQKQKLGSSQKKCDVELLQKLKASHQNLVAKNRALLTEKRRCWCGYQSESANVIEHHRLECGFHSRCCFCHGQFTYRTQNQMKRHLWKDHGKVGYLIDRITGYACFFCPLDLHSRQSFVQHLDVCRRKFSLAANLVPGDFDKDIPVTVTSRQLVPIPAVSSSGEMPPGTTTSNLSVSTSVSTATVASPAVASRAISLQLAQGPRIRAPVTQFLQIGKQIFTLLPSTAVAAPAIAVNQSSAIKSVSRMALSSALQTAQSASSALPTVVSNIQNTTTATSASENATPATSQAITIPPSILRRTLPCSVCSVCGAFVKDKTALLIHMHIAHGATHKMCQYCCSADVTFANDTELHYHIAKFHTSDCWVCKTRFQPPEHLVNHIAGRHKVTMAQMLELRRCYLCSSVPFLPSYVAFEEHMMSSHALQFADAGKLWEHIVHSPNADKTWYAKRNADGTLECPICHDQFISASFLYRHTHLEHNGRLVKLVHCRECGKSMPSNILGVHLVAAHTRKCSVKVYRLEMADRERVFIPPVGTKRIKNRKGERVSSRPSKRVKVAETVVISDDDDDDDGNDHDFVLTSRLSIQPTTRRNTRTRVDRRNSSADDVREVLESIVDSDESATAPRRCAGFPNTSICRDAVGAGSAVQLCNGITEAEVEIIESIVPTIRDRHRPAVSNPQRSKPTDRASTSTDSAAGEKSTGSEVVHAAERSDVGDYPNRDCQRLSTKPKSALSESPAQHLMARDQIMMNSVEEVMEIDGETVLIVHDDDDDNDDD